MKNKFLKIAICLYMLAGSYMTASTNENVVEAITHSICQDVTLTPSQQVQLTQLVTDYVAKQLLANDTYSDERELIREKAKIDEQFETDFRLLLSVQQQLQWEQAQNNKINSQNSDYEK